MLSWCLVHKRVSTSTHPVPPSCPAEMLELLRLGGEPGPVCQSPLGTGHVQPQAPPRAPTEKAKSAGPVPWTQGGNPTDPWPSLPTVPQPHSSLLLSGSFAGLLWTSFRCWGSQGSSSPSFLSPRSYLPLPELPLSLAEELPWRSGNSCTYRGR